MKYKTIVTTALLVVASQQTLAAPSQEDCKRARMFAYTSMSSAQFFPEAFKPYQEEYIKQGNVPRRNMNIMKKVFDMPRGNTDAERKINIVQFSEDVYDSCLDEGGWDEKQDW